MDFREPLLGSSSLRVHHHRPSRMKVVVSRTQYHTVVSFLNDLQHSTCICWAAAAAPGSSSRRRRLNHQFPFQSARFPCSAFSHSELPSSSKLRYLISSSSPSNDGHISGVSFVFPPPRVGLLDRISFYYLHYQPPSLSRVLPPKSPLRRGCRSR